MVNKSNKQMYFILFIITINKYADTTEWDTKPILIQPKRYKRYNHGGDGFDAYSPYNFGHYYPDWKPERYSSHNYHGPSHWEQDTGHRGHDYDYGFQYPHPVFKQSDYDSSESENDYAEIPQRKRPFNNPIKTYDYPEQSIPDLELPELSNENKETTTTTTERASIIGKPVIVPPDDDLGDQIIFPDTTLETSAQRRCVQDCTTTSEYIPVCGTNNVTYFNTGKFKCARDCGIDVFIKSYGRCPGAKSERRRF